MPSDEPAAAVSTEKLFEIAGEYVGKDDPVALVRSQSGCQPSAKCWNPGRSPISSWLDAGSHNALSCRSLLKRKVHSL